MRRSFNRSPANRCRPDDGEHSKLAFSDALIGQFIFCARSESTDRDRFFRIMNFSFFDAFFCIMNHIDLLKPERQKISFEVINFEMAKQIRCAAAVGRCDASHMEHDASITKSFTLQKLKGAWEAPPPRTDSIAPVITMLLAVEQSEFGCSKSACTMAAMPRRCRQRPEAVPAALPPARPAQPLSASNAPPLPLPPRSLRGRPTRR